MNLFQKKDAVDIYSLFLTKLSKIEALFLFGLYYSNNERFTEEEIDEKITIAQQLLTYLKRNPYPVLENKDTINSLFFDNDDEVDKSCHPDYLIGDALEIDIEKIQDLLSEFNSRLEIPAALVFIEKKEEEIPEIEDLPEENIVEVEPEDTVFRESDNAKEVIDKFLSYFPPLSKKQLRKHPRSVLLLGISNGRFISRFYSEKFHVYFIEDDPDKVRKIKRLPNVVRFDTDYLDTPEEAYLDAVWSYIAIGRMKKDEIVQALKNIEIGLMDDGYACISFLYGNGHKTINNHYYTLMDEDSFRTIVAKAKGLQIVDIWNREYVKSDGTVSKRLNVILQKKEVNSTFKIFDNDHHPLDWFPKSIDVQKLQLTSKASLIEMPEIGTEIEQKITISKDGRIWITRNKLIDNSDEIITEQIEKKIISIDKDSAERIFFMVYRSVFLNQREKLVDSGEWTLTLTATNEDIFNATGSFGIPVLFNDKTDVCKLIRESIPVDGLWIFDNSDE